MTDAAGKSFIDLTATIVSAYLSHNPTPASEIPNLISQVHAALLRISTGRAEAPLDTSRRKRCGMSAMRRQGVRRVRTGATSGCAPLI